MKMEISQSQVFELANYFANIIHGGVVQMHLRRSWGIWESAENPCPYALSDHQREQIQDIRRSIRSIKNCYDRLSFVRSVRFCFLKLREEKRTDPKFQDYVARVRQAKAENDARQIGGGK